MVRKMARMVHDSQIDLPLFVFGFCRKDLARAPMRATVIPFVERWSKQSGQDILTHPQVDSLPVVIRQLFVDLVSGTKRLGRPRTPIASLAQIPLRALSGEFERHIASIRSTTCDNLRFRSEVASVPLRCGHTQVPFYFRPSAKQVAELQQIKILLEVRLGLNASNLRDAHSHESLELECPQYF